MKNSIYFKNFIATSVIVFLSFLILGSLFGTWSYRLILAEKRESMSRTLDEASRSVAAQSMRYNFYLGEFDIRITLSAISSVSGFNLLVADTDGMIVSCSDQTIVCPHLGQTVPADTLNQMTGPDAVARRSNLGGIFADTRYVTGAPIAVGINGTPYLIGYIFVSSDTTAMITAWREFTSVFIFIALAVLFITFIGSLLASKRQARPLNEMAYAARRFARGDFSARVDYTMREDEIGHLTVAFNQMADSLERSEMLRRDFIANISHELKTPMTVIAGFADGIRDGTIPPEQEGKYLDVISSETMRLSRLVKSMLDMSRIQSADTAELLKNKFDLSEVIRLALVGLESKIEAKGLDVEAELPEEAVITRGDRDSITQVVYNLVDNAIKFSEPGAALRIGLWKHGAKAFVSVENKGETISEGELPLIFERFHKTDKSRSANKDGVGLGLYIVKTILNNHNEDIYVTSEDGVTKFVFTLTTAGHGKDEK